MGSVLALFFIEMPINGYKLKKLAHVKWQLQQGKVPGGFR